MEPWTDEDWAQLAEEAPRLIYPGMETALAPEPLSVPATNTALRRARDRWDRHKKKITPTILRRDEYRCVYCGATDVSGIHLVPDHVLALSASGAPCDPDNLVTACNDCNTRKGAKPVETWLLAFIGEAA